MNFILMANQFTILLIYNRMQPDVFFIFISRARLYARNPFSAFATNNFIKIIAADVLKMHSLFP